MYLLWSITEAHGLYLDHRRGKLATVRKIECQNLYTEKKQNGQHITLINANTREDVTNKDTKAEGFHQ